MRRRRAKVKFIPPDSKYNSVDLAKFINRIMMNGKKTLAAKIVYDALDRLSKLADEPALDAFQRAVNNVTPAVEVRPRRVGGANYQVPHEVRPRRKTILAQRWLIQAARARKGRPIVEKLAQELHDAYRGIGAAVKRKENMHSMAEANRAFVHHRW